MTRFIHAHAAHPQAAMAFALAAAQVDGQRAQGACAEPTLGWIYFTDRLADQAGQVLGLARQRWPAVSWVGAVGVGICASGVEYFGEGAVALMLCDLPRDRFRVFSGARPLQADAAFTAHTALVHADPRAPDLGELVAELSDRTASGYLFGGLASTSSADAAALLVADGIWSGGLAGVAFDADVPIVSRVTQGSQPIGPRRRVTGVDGQVVLTLDDQGALDVLLDDLGLARDIDLRRAVPRLRSTMVGLSDAAAAGAAVSAAPLRGDAFGEDVRVRHVIGVDPARRAVAIAELAVPGQFLAFSRRDTDAARRDLVRICAEIRDELSPEELPQPSAVGAAAALAAAHDGAARPSGAERIAGAIYVSCAGRGGPHFGAPSAEMQLVRHALGDVPLVGFFAAGEIGHHHLYGYTGVLTVFVDA
jgi:small ligand-binding sensory domain FIST